jgi:hypothetical protein
LFVLGDIECEGAVVLEFLWKSEDSVPVFEDVDEVEDVLVDGKGDLELLLLVVLQVEQEFVHLLVFHVDLLALCLYLL